MYILETFSPLLIKKNNNNNNKEKQQQKRSHEPEKVSYSIINTFFGIYEPD